MARARKNGMFDFLTEKKVTYKRSVPKASKRRKATVDDEKPATWTREDAEKALKRWKRLGYNPAKIQKLLKAKRNPVDAAADLSEAWSGVPAKYLDEYHETLHYHGVLTNLARLVEFEILVDGNHVQRITFDKKTRVASNEAGEQLYVVDGDQGLDLGAFGIEGHAAKKDFITIGPIYAMTYYMAKLHLGEEDKTPGPYRHPFGEDRIEKGEAASWRAKGYEVYHRPGADGGWFRKHENYPDLIYDTMNDLCGLSGGEYHIDRDMDGIYSLGIKD